ncbi:TPA: hypothetical protein I3321_000396 [Enterobacter roggenkampii]|nr:hypothetical protein [Enterobacter roggenkampii]
MAPVPEDTIFTASNIINFFVAFGTCTAVLVALIAKKQSSFESTFSLLLTQHNNALNELRKKTNYSKLINEMMNGLIPLKETNTLMHNHDAVFGSYFRILYHLLKFIDNNAGYHPFDLARKKNYTSLVRAHLDNEITYLLAINCAHADSENQYQLYKILIERYAMLEHLILNKSVLLKYTPSDLNEIQKSLRVTTIMLSEDIKTIFNEITKIYFKSAFGKNPELKNFL